MNQISSINDKQAEFYDQKYVFGKARNLNAAMSFWIEAKKSLKKYMKGRNQSINIQIKDIHREWIVMNPCESVLDLGCGPGSSFTYWLIGNSIQYVGIDLSAQAVKRLKSTIDESRFPNAIVRQMDFFYNDFPADHFDLIYASAVLHHFPDFPKLCSEIHRILKPGGIIISSDSMQIHPAIILIRRFYRLFQSNREWEWPFKKSNFRILNRYFTIEKVQGFLGLVSLLGFLLSFIPGYKRLSEKIYRFGIDRDLKKANRIGTALWQCNVIAMQMRKL